MKLKITLFGLVFVGLCLLATMAEDVETEIEGEGEAANSEEGGVDENAGEGNEQTEDAEPVEETEPPTKRPSATKKPEKTGSGDKSSEGGGGGKYDPKMSKEAANKRFKGCCQKSSDMSGCVDVCKYDVTNAELEKYFMSSGATCGLGRMRKYLYCANDQNDIIPCCRYKNIPKPCESFCTASGPETLTPDHMQCGPRLTDIMRCHWWGLSS